MKKSIFIFFIIFLHETDTCFSQKEGNIWYFGDHAGLDFNSGTPVALTNGVDFAYDNSSAIADSNGNILFYTNGQNIWDKTHAIMNNGSGLIGSNNGGQCVLIVPQPMSTIYYVFTVDQFVGSNGFNYSIVDITLNGGLGQVTSKNNLLFSPSTERIDAYYNCDDDTYWIVTHQWGNNTFNAYKLTSTGLNTVPITSSIGFSHSGASYNSMGQLTISPMGGLLACAVYDQDIIELFDFDKSTGIVSNPRTITAFGNAWGVAFCPDETRLYATNWFGTDITQFDLTAGSIANIIASATVVGTVTGPGTSGYYIGYIQLAPDNKIYIAKYGDDYIAAINTPDLLGNMCGFVDNAVYLGGKTCLAGLARTEYPSYPKANSITASGFCLGDSTYFSLAAQGFNSVLWNFGDPASGLNNTDTIPSPVHFFQTTGIYNVYSINIYNCITDTVFYTVTIQPTANASITGTDTICTGDTIQLTGSGGGTYQWSGALSSTDSIISISPVTTSTYILNVNNGNCPGIADTFIVVPVVLQSLFTVSIDTCLKTVHFNNQSVNAASQVWNFGDLSSDTSQSPTHIYADTGSYTVSLISTNACGNDTFQVNIYLPKSGITQSNFNVMLDSCLKEITLINNSSSADHYLWSFGDGYTDTVFSPTHIYLNQGSYQIQLIASNSCNSDTFSLNIIIPDFVFPIADFSVNLDTCTKTISCVNSSGNADQYLWYFGDGQSDTAWNPVHVYTTANIFHILLTVSNNCGADSIDIPVAIPDYLNVNADFLFTTDSCNLSASFMNLSVNASQYYWNFGDSVNGNFQNGIHTYADTGSYMVMLIAQNTCTSDTIFKPVRISMINVTGNFDVSADTCELSVQVVNMISGASSFYWNFGDGGYDTATNPHHFYTQPGTYVISVISNPFSNCSDTMLSSITFEDGSANYFFLPNVFTPNDDGLNDLFEISGNESCLDFTLKVYNRWGEQIFTTDTPFQKFWDGRFKGKPVPDGTYVYLIDGKQVHRGGVVSILR